MWQWHPWAIVPILASGFSILATWWGLRRTTARGPVHEFVPVSLGLAVGCLGQALDLSSTHPQFKFAALCLSLCGLVPLPATALRFCLVFTGRGAWLTPARFFLLLAPALLALGLFVTNPLHHLMADSRLVTTDDGAVLRQSTPRAGLYLYVVYSYVLGAVPAIIYAVELWSGSWLSRRQSALLLAGAVLPGAINAAFVSGLLPFAYVDGSALGFLVTAVAWTLAIGKGRMFDLFPVARARVFDAMADPVAVVDRHDRVLDANQAFWELVGSEAKGASGRTLTELGLERRPYFERGGRHYRVVDRSVDTQPARSSVLLFREVTAQVAAIQVLQDTASRAADASARRDAFIAKLSHELRTPLHGILGATTLALDARLEPSLRHVLEASLRGGKELIALVDEILAFERGASGAIEAERRPFDLHELLADVTALSQAGTHGKPVAVALELGAEVPRHAVGDPGKLRQVLVNLCANAVKFTAQGTVRLSASAAPKGAEAFALEVRVSDPGPGIDPTRLERIFEPFRQADDSTSRTHGGTGLGLAISKGLVALMGGSVSVDSVLGQGSTFTVRMALGLEAPAAAAVPDEGPRVVLTGRRVLLVDDHELGRLVSSGLLRGAGFEVTAASSGEEALALVEDDQAFDLLLVDRRMPGLSGHELIERLRAEGVATPAFFLTADLTIDSLPAGVRGVLAKPLSLAQLHRLVGTSAAPQSPPVISAELVRLFADTSAKEVAELSAADEAVARLALHHLLGSAKMVGAAELVRVCAAHHGRRLPLDETQRLAFERARELDLARLGARP